MKETPTHPTTLQSFYSNLPSAIPFKNGTGNLNGNLISISYINNRLLERLFRCISCLSPSSCFGPVWRSINGRSDCWISSQSFSLINMWWGLGNKRWTTISHQFREVKVIPDEGPFLTCVSIHEEIAFISVIQDLFVHVITHSQGFLRGYKTDLGPSHCHFLLCATMKDLISVGPPSCVFY